MEQAIARQDRIEEEVAPRKDGCGAGGGEVHMGHRGIHVGGQREAGLEGHGAENQHARGDPLSDNRKYLPFNSKKRIT